MEEKFLNFYLNKTYCNFYLKKNGKMKYLPLYNYNKYLCITKKIQGAILIHFPDLYSKNEDEILKKILILDYCKKFNLKYFRTTNNKMYLFNDDIKGMKDITINILFLQYITNINSNAYNFFYKNIEKLLITSFMINRLHANLISDQNILINIFYEIYIFEIESEIIEKFNKSIKDFANYHQLYSFLKEKGYVKKYYNEYAHNMIHNYNKFYKKLLSYKELSKFKLENEKDIKDFKNIDLIQIIDKYVNNRFNKTYIKNKFIEITKNN